MFRPTRMLLRAFVLLLSAGCSAAATQGAPPTDESGDYLVENYTMRDYLAHNQVWRAVQDARGVLYFGNRDVILEFDGETWRQIDVPRGLFVRGLAIDHEGTIWVGAVDELGYLAPDDKGQLEYVSLRDQLPEGERHFGDIWETYATTDGVFFTTNHTFFRWKDGVFTIWHRTSSRTTIALPVGGALYLFERDVGLSRLVGDQWVLESKDPFFRTTAVSFAFPQPDGGWLLVTADRGLFQYRNGVVTPFATSVNDLLKAADIYSAVRLRDGSLALGTLLRGLVILRPDFTVEAIVDQQAGLYNASVKDILEDREGGLWLSLNNGIAHVERGPLTILDQRRGLPTETIHQIVRHRGRLYLAANLGLYTLAPGDPLEGGARLRVIDGIPGRVMSLATHESGLIVANRHQAILVDGDQRTRIGGEYSTIHQLYRSPTDPDRVFEGFTQGLAAMRWQEGGWVDEGAVPGINDDVREMAQTAAGMLWAGTPSRGILRIELGAQGRGPITEARVTRFDGGRGLPDDPGWTSAHLTEDGTLYFRTNAGLFTFDEATQTFVPFHHYGRRFADGTYLVSRLVAEANGTVWASVYPLQGELFLSPWGRGFLGRAVPDGAGGSDWQILPPAIFSPIANLSALFLEETATGRTLWVGAERGLVHIDLDRYAPRREFPPVVLRRVATGEKRDVYGGARPATFAVPILPHAEAGLRFSFAAPNQHPAHSLLYQTRLDGFDDRWSTPSRELHREFTNLFEGHYRFRVRATDALGQPGPETDFAFRVLPPWWRAPAAYAAWLVLTGLAMFGLVRWRVVRLRRENERLEAIVAERTINLQAARAEADRANRAKSAFLANMSHELRTPLNAILGYAQVLERDPQLDPRNRQRVAVLSAGGEHLRKLVNEVLDLSKIEAGRMEVRYASVRPRLVVEGVAEAFRPRLQERGLEFAVTIDPALPDRVLLDEQKIGQVLFNLLGNAVKFTERGSVELRVAQIIDTSVGPDPASEPMTTEAVRTRGRGATLGVVRPCFLKSSTPAWASHPQSRWGSSSHFNRRATARMRRRAPVSASRSRASSST